MILAAEKSHLFLCECGFFFRIKETPAPKSKSLSIGIS